MEGKLIKEGSFGYKIKFYNDDDMAACALGLLSLKNCQAIENGYDLDKLADEEFPLLELTNHTSDTYVKEENLQLLGHRKTYIKGFQKALELMGDKKFSKDDIIDCWETAHQAGRFEEKGIAETNWQTAINYAQALQQTEWDVEVEMECLDKNCDGINRKGECITTGKPKYDTDGCLILKRV